jgi:glycerol-3-phosphate dehydrogenase (NAD(P)+)
VKIHHQFHVLILGHGEMGQAMEQLLARHRLTVWERRPKAGPPVALETLAGRQDFVLFCVPAVPHFDLARRLRPHLRPDTLCLSVAKGLDARGRTAARALADALNTSEGVGVLYGPMIAEEIRAGRPAFAVAGTARRETCARIRALYAGTALHLEPSTDIAGLSWSAVLKNPYAMLFGAADELRLGDNVRGCLMVRAVEELAGLVASLGGRAETARGLAGLGDLVTTATSAGSRHHELGRCLARGQAATEAAEGVHTLRMVRAHGLFDIARYPLFHLIERLLAEPASTSERLHEWIAAERR